MSETAFLLKKILAPLILPPTGLLLCAALGLLLLNRWPRIGKLLAWTGIVLVLALSLPFTASLLVDAVVVESGLKSDGARSAQAIVILGGGRKNAPEYGGSTLSAAALERVRYGAKLASEVQLPILVTGGNVFGSGPSEAEVMAATLRQSFASEAKWIEDRARDTHDNAVLSAAMLKAEGIHTVLLVTHDLHQRRALREFAAAGITTIPAPVTIAGRSDGKVSVAQRLPNAGALSLSSQALHEIIGTAVLAPRTAEVR
jgi:uncharacterized SAM-binding protein YcdF (DUF218 family)